MRPKELPSVRVTPDQVWLDGGLDLISPPGLAKPGTCRFAINYELEFGGGYRRVGGFERFDGRPAPSNAEYVVLQVDVGSTATVGMTVEGSTSGAEGKIVWISQDGLYLGLTRLLAGFVFEDGEDLELASTPVATIVDASPSIDAFVDNDVFYASAEDYRTPIAKPAGQYQIRGVAILNNQVFCWRDVGAAMKIYKATSSGWTEVPLKKRISFSSGTTEYLDGGSLTQGAVSAIIRRVVLTAGSWTGGTAEGYFVIDDPVGGSFIGGAATGSGACTLAGPETPIQLLAGGRVATFVHNFYGSEELRRLYGCDGINPEFEFDGTTLVPIETGMGNRRASHVIVHKNHLFFAYGSSIQHSGVGEPYKWTPLFGAAEIALGDPVTNFISVSGSETSAALMVTSRNSTHVLYGTSSADWDLKVIANEAGAQAFSAQLMGSPIVFDRDGFNRNQPTDVYGNFSYESESRMIDPLVRNATVMCSVLVKNKSRYRCFFTDGTFVSGTPIKGGIGWMPCDYGRTITCAVGGEIAGQYRVFMGDMDGWVLEADVGRSFDGEEVESGLRLSSMNQRSPVLEKQFRYAEFLVEAESAFAMAFGAEYSDASAAEAQLAQTDMVDFKKQYGVGLFWDFNAWDRAYWDGSAANRVRYDIGGLGRSITYLFSTASDREAPHTLKVATTIYSPRRLAR